jgi:SAM-dependent methyltransferase
MPAGPPRIFDRLAFRARRARAAGLGGDIFLAHEPTGHITARLGAINRRFARALDLDSRPELFTALRPFTDEWVRAGFVHDRPEVVADAENLPFADGSFDLVTSVLSLHAVNDLPGALTQIRRLLKPDGLFIAALFGGQTLQELRQAFVAAEAETLGGASPRIAPFGEVRELGGLLQRAGFTLPVADVERVLVRYRDTSRLFADLRALGETNVLVGRRAALLSRRTLERLTAEYAARFADSAGRLAATFDIVFLTGWSPHEGQQKPLAPGSAKMRLAEALGTVEKSAGEKPQR